MNMRQAIAEYTKRKQKPGGQIYAAGVKRRADEFILKGETDDMNEAMLMAVCENSGAKPDFE